MSGNAFNNTPICMLVMFDHIFTFLLTYAGVVSLIHVLIGSPTTIKVNFDHDVVYYKKKCIPSPGGVIYMMLYPGESTYICPFHLLPLY